MELAKAIDHTLLKATAMPSDISVLCAEAKEHGFFSVCVNSSYVSLAKTETQESDVKVCAVVGFPLGAMSIEAKVFETEQAIRDGADEIDMVIHVGRFKSGESSYIGEEIHRIKSAAGDRVLKVILETCYLTKEEIQAACEIAVENGADFVKTSTGFGTGGATREDIGLMLETVGGKAQVKASGGVKSREMAEDYLSMGVTRIGTSSGIAIVTGEQGIKGGY